jgi:hypothetical protein
MRYLVASAITFGVLGATAPVALFAQSKRTEPRCNGLSFLLALPDDPKRPG